MPPRSAVRFLGLVSIFISLFLFSACSPRFDWREVRDSKAPLRILMPAKALAFSESVKLADQALTMHMTAAEAGQVSFAVGSVELKNRDDGGLVLAAMRQGMIKNIHGTVTKDSGGPDGLLEINGSLQNGTPVFMAARFIAHGQWVYQLIILGPPKKVTPEVVDTFMTSLVLE